MIVIVVVSQDENGAAGCIAGTQFFPSLREFPVLIFFDGFLRYSRTLSPSRLCELCVRVRDNW